MPDTLGGAYAAALDALIGPERAATDRLGIAVSGGPDSMALLSIAAACAPGRVEAATVDHGLRSEAAGEAAGVAGWCARAGIPHAILRPEAAITGSLQAEARRVRYRLLDRWRAERGLDWLLTAHHADDQMETMLMRLARASGVAGLAGIRARRGRVLRPLLGRRRAELVDHAAASGLPVVDDPANSDLRFDRTRVRRHLGAAPWLDAAAAARSAAALADADAALAWSVEALVADAIEREDDTLRLTRTDLPREYLRRLLAHMVAHAAPDARVPRGGRMEQAVVQLLRGRTVSIGACIARGGDVWTVRRAGPRRGG